jgi:hypothetical protein
MTIITKGMGIIAKHLGKKRKTLTISESPKPSKTKLSDTWQDRRIDAMNRKIKRRKAGTDRYIDEHGAII